MSDGDLFTGLARGVEAAVAAVDKGVKELIADVTGHPAVSTSAAPATHTSLAELRWEGMSNAQLAAAVQQLHNGTSASAMTQAADALATVAADLAKINDALQTQLQAIGVNWQSQSASELADQMIATSAAYGGSATDQGGQASTSINQQAEAYATARNGAPQPQTLLGNTQAGASGSLISQVGSPLTGHGTDQTQQANRANAARSQAIDTLNNYTSASQANLGSYQPPPPPPAIGVQTQAPPSGGSGVTSVSGYVPPSGTGPSGGTVPSGVTSLPPGVSGGGTGSTPPSLSGVGTPGGVGLGVGATGGVPAGSQSGAGFPGGLASLTGGLTGGTTGGLPSGGGFPSGGIVPGGGGGLPGGGSSSVPPGSPNLPAGPISGIGSTGVPSAGQSGAALSGGAASAGLSEDIGSLAGGAAVAGGAAAVGIVGANSEGDKVVKGSGSQPGGFAEDEEDFAPRSGVGPLAELDSEQATAARVSAQLAPTEEVAPGLLEPAVGGRRGEDDAEHRNSYADAADDFFDDGRMVVPDVLGGATDDEQDA